MIISLRGTNGAGKSTLVRRIMTLYKRRTQVQYPHASKKKPMGYVCENGDGPGLFIPGHYEIANGGVDTLPDLDTAYALIDAHATLGCHVLYEGKNLSDGPKRLIEMHESGAHQVQAVFIKVSLDQAIKSVRKRGHNISEKTIVKLHTKSAADMVRLKAAGVPAVLLSRNAAFEHVRGVLGL